MPWCHHGMHNEAGRPVLVLLHELSLEMVLLSPLALRLRQSLLPIDLLSVVWQLAWSTEVIGVCLRLRCSMLDH